MNKRIIKQGKKLSVKEKKFRKNFKLHLFRNSIRLSKLFSKLNNSYIKQSFIMKGVLKQIREYISVL